MALGAQGARAARSCISCPPPAHLMPRMRLQGAAEEDRASCSGSGSGRVMVGCAAMVRSNGRAGAACAHAARPPCSHSPSSAPISCRRLIPAQDRTPRTRAMPAARPAPQPDAAPARSAACHRRGALPGAHEHRGGARQAHAAGARGRDAGARARVVRWVRQCPVRGPPPPLSLTAAPHRRPAPPAGPHRHRGRHCRRPHCCCRPHRPAPVGRAAVCAAGSAPCHP